MRGVRRIPTGKARLVTVIAHDRRVEDVVAALLPYCERKNTTGYDKPARTYIDAEGNIALVVDRYSS